jgi:hypothetical protein
MREGPRSPDRRRWRRRTLAFGALAALSGGVAWVRTGGYALDDATASRLVSLAPWQYVVVEHLARRIVAPDQPGDATIPSADDVGVASFLDAYLAGMRPSLRRDLLHMLGVVEHLAPFAAGHAHRFTELAPTAQDEVLRSLEASRFDLLRAGFDGLKSLVMMGYWRDARTWTLIGYPGPLVGGAAEAPP